MVTSQNSEKSEHTLTKPGVRQQASWEGGLWRPCFCIATTPGGAAAELLEVGLGLVVFSVASSQEEELHVGWRKQEQAGTSASVTTPSHDEFTGD